MSWGLGWKRPSEVFHLILSYGSDADNLDDVTPTSSRSSSASSPFSSSSPTSSLQDGGDGGNQEQLGFRVDLEWNAGDDEDQTALKLQSQVMVALPSPQDTVQIKLRERDKTGESNSKSGVDDGAHLANGDDGGESDLGNSQGDGVELEMSVVKRREPLKGMIIWRAGGSGQQNDGGMGVLVKLMRSNFANTATDGVAMGSGCAEHWKNVNVVSLCGLGLAVSPLLSSLL